MERWKLGYFQTGSGGVDEQRGLALMGDNPFQCVKCHFELLETSTDISLSQFYSTESKVFLAIVTS